MTPTKLNTRSADGYCRAYSSKSRLHREDQTAGYLRSEIFKNNIPTYLYIDYNAIVVILSRASFHLKATIVLTATLCIHTITNWFLNCLYKFDSLFDWGHFWWHNRLQKHTCDERKSNRVLIVWPWSDFMFLNSRSMRVMLSRYLHFSLYPLLGNRAEGVGTCWAVIFPLQNDIQ